jgi:hypothetical protein
MRFTLPQNVWFNLAFAVAFTVFLATFSAVWHYFEGKPIHYLRSLAIYSFAGLVMFIVLQSSKRRDT